MGTTTIEIGEKALKDAAGNGMESFMRIFVSKYKEVIGDNPKSENMLLLNDSQHTLLAYMFFRDEMLEGGCCQLIQNGYGGYIFDNPFAKEMRLWGLLDFSKLLYQAKKIYDAHRGDLEKERSDEEFMAMYEQYEEFDDLDDAFVEKEHDITELIARYVDEHIEDFAKIVK
jgi:hypothetical protein